MAKGCAFQRVVLMLAVLVGVAGIATAQISSPGLQGDPGLTANVSRNADKFGDLGEALKAGVESGDIILRYAGNLEEKGQSGYENGKLVIEVNVRYANQAFWTMFICLHEMAHHYPSDDPLPPQPGSDPTPGEVAANACIEATAHCEAMDALIALQAWLSAHDLSPISCVLLQTVRVEYIGYWEKCHGQFWVGSDGSCDAVDTIMSNC